VGRKEVPGPGSGWPGELWGGVDDSTIGRSGLGGNSQWEGLKERKGLLSFLIDRLQAYRVMA
jgi:hypothetical protein